MSGFDLTTLLKTALPEVVPSGVGRWTFPLAPGARESVTMELVPHWACFTLPSRFDQPPSPMMMLLRQSAWPGNVKVIAEAAYLALRAEVPLIVETVADRSWVTRHVGKVVQGLRVAAENRSPDMSADSDSGCDTIPELLADRCRAAGWHAAVKADGEIQVDIEPRSVRRVVSIVRQQAGLRARVQLGIGEFARTGKEHLRAVTHFLLRASSSLRFARAWVSGEGGSLLEAGFECTISVCASDGPLVMAIGALTTACDLFACEAEALIENTTVAHRYLQVAQGVRRCLPQPIMQLHAPKSDLILPLAAGAAVPVHQPYTREGAST